MRLSISGQSPNTTAALIGGMLVLFALLYRRRWPLWLWVPWGGAGLALCLTQSRSAGVALLSLAVLIGAAAMSRRNLAPMVVMLALLGAATWGWAARHGRFAGPSLGNAAGVRMALAEAGLMRAAEARLHGVASFSQFAEDVALRYGVPVTFEQAKVIRNPLSSLLFLLEGGWWSVGVWICWLAPAGFLIMECVGSARLRIKEKQTPLPDGTSFQIFPKGRSREDVLTWAIPAFCFYTAVCAIFNDLHQDRWGRVLVMISAIAGATWLCREFGRGNVRLPLAGVGMAVVLQCLLLGLGEWRLRENCSRQNIQAWNISTKAGDGDRGSTVIEGRSDTIGTLVLFYYGVPTPRTWECRKHLYRLVGQGWRLVEARSSANVTDWRREGPFALPVIGIGIDGPVPGSFSRFRSPGTIVSISPSRLDMITDDGAGPARRHWVVFGDAEMHGAKRVLWQKLYRTESDTTIHLVADDSSARLQSVFRHIADQSLMPGKLSPPAFQ